MQFMVIMEFVLDLLWVYYGFVVAGNAKIINNRDFFVIFDDSRFDD